MACLRKWLYRRARKLALLYLLNALAVGLLLWYLYGDTSVLNNEEVRIYLKRYTYSCEKFRLRQPANDLETLQYCPCVSQLLVGSTVVNKTAPTWNELSHLYDGAVEGGEWAPRDCMANQKVAIVIPYRDREPHLRAFLRHMTPLLQRQLIHYRIFVIEQIQPPIFNKGSLMNIVFLEAEKRFQPDCVIFNDVDTLLENDYNIYHCRPGKAVHLGAYVDRFQYQLPYLKAFGAVTSFFVDDFKKVGGFSTEFFGWGGEDDDMSRRVEFNFIARMRPPRLIARYTTLEHERDTGNPVSSNRKDGMRHRPRTYTSEMLRRTDYVVSAEELHPLYTLLKTKYYPRTKPHIQK